MSSERTGGLLGLLKRRKYELLLAGLLQHLFIGVVLPDLEFYARFIWPVNMVLLGLLSVGVFEGRGAKHRAFKNAVLVLVCAFPFVPFILGARPEVMATLSLCYVLFFAVILVEVLRFLLRPSYLNADIISAAIGGYLLLLEVGVFSVQALYYLVPEAFGPLDTSTFTATYLDIVYFCSVTLTTIGYGDITASHHITKLAVSMLGIAGHLYSVVLVGVLIGKYTSARTDVPGASRRC